MKRRIKTFESFLGYFGEDDWEKDIEYIHRNYKKGKINNLFAKKIIENNGKTDYEIRYEKNGEIYLYRLSESKASLIHNYVIIHKNKKGKFVYNGISKSKYEKSVNKIKDVIDYLEEKDKGNHTIDYYLNLSDEEAADIQYDVSNDEFSKKFFQDYIGKIFEFESQYELYDNNVKKINVNENISFLFSKIYFLSDSLILRGMLKNIKVVIIINKSTIEEYLDISNLTEKELKEQSIFLYKDTKSMSYDEKVKDETEYPKFFNMYLSPSSYDTIEFIKYTKRVLNSIIDKL